MHPNTLRRLTLALLAAGALGTLAALVWAGDGLGTLSGAGLGFAAWALLPYAALAVGLSRFWSARARVAGLVGAGAVVLGAAALYADALWLHPDAQGALAFVFVPVVQLAVVLGTVGLAWVLHRRGAATA
ncbi:MAG TPA: hypothetical protein VGB53_11935 [Rubricoccaceae bacterium]|jgi:ABC-type Na+ efflux pump permease subunit